MKLGLGDNNVVKKIKTDIFLFLIVIENTAYCISRKKKKKNLPQPPLQKLNDICLRKFDFLSNEDTTLNLKLSNIISFIKQYDLKYVNHSLLRQKTPC